MKPSAPLRPLPEGEGETSPGVEPGELLSIPSCRDGMKPLFPGGTSPAVPVKPIKSMLDDFLANPHCIRISQKPFFKTFFPEFAD